jgi:transcriptional antiterminator Rof (Rho-off)
VNDDAYTPIACGLHDELQLLALRGSEVRIVARDHTGGAVTLEGRAADVLSRGGAEWLVLADGTFIRLDHITTVDGRPFHTSC